MKKFKYCKDVETETLEFFWSYVQGDRNLSWGRCECFRVLKRRCYIRSADLGWCRRPKLIVVVNCDISNFMVDFTCFTLVYFWQNAKNSFKGSSPSFQIKNISSIKRSLFKCFFLVFYGSHSEVMFWYVCK